MTARNAIGVVNKVSGAAVPVTQTSDARFGLAALVRRAATMRAKSGVIHAASGGNLAVSGTSGWNYSVEPGAGVSAPDAGSGAYIVPNDGTYLASCPIAPTSGSRIDYIYILQADAWDRSAGATAASIAVASGASSTGTPTPPTVPDGALILAQNQMFSTATATNSSGNTITQLSPFTSPAGGVQVYRNATEQATDLAASLVADGDLSFRADTQRPQTFGLTLGTFSPLAFMNDASPSVASAAARDILYPPASVQQGNSVFRNDLGWDEMYHAAYNASTNPGGALVAGWYPANTGPTLYAIPAASQTVGTAATRFGWTAPNALTGFSFSLSNGAFTVPYTGLYRITIAVTTSAATTTFWVQDTLRAGNSFAGGNGIGAVGSGAGLALLVAGTSYSPFATGSTSATCRTGTSWLSVEWADVQVA